VDSLGREWPLNRYAEVVARTTTREAMTQGTINRLGEHGIQLGQVSTHNAEDFCRYYENAVVSLNGSHPVYPPISAINGGPPFHPNCVHVLTPFVERLATHEEKKRGIISRDLLNKSPAELQRRFRKQYPGIARRAARRYQNRGEAGSLRGKRTDPRSRKAERTRRRTNRSGRQSPPRREDDPHVGDHAGSSVFLREALTVHQLTGPRASVRICEKTYNKHGRPSQAIQGAGGPDSSADTRPARRQRPVRRGACLSTGCDPFRGLTALADSPRGRACGGRKAGLSSSLLVGAKQDS